MIRRLFPFVLVLMAVIAGPLAGAHAKTEYNASFFGGTAIEGTDAVAYFTQGKPVEGSSDFTAHWKGAKWRFASAGNRDLFKADPEKYAPQFGGYCAFAVSRGYTASIDPKAWSIVNGKLYLNYSLGVRAQWNEDVPGNIRLGEKNWPKLRADLLN